MAEGSVTIIVKAPNQQFADQTIECEVSWTIKRLKNYLSEVYPNQPVSEYFYMYCVFTQSRWFLSIDFHHTYTRN